MHCKELVKGKKWVCVADGPRNPRTGKRKQIPRRGKTKAEAMKKVIQAIEEINHSMDYHEKVTFKDFSKDWYNIYRNRGHKENTNVTREFSIKKMNLYFGSVQLKKITTKMYQACLMIYSMQENLIVQLR